MTRHDCPWSMTAGEHNDGARLRAPRPCKSCEKAMGEWVDAFVISFVEVKYHSLRVAFRSAS